MGYVTFLLDGAFLNGFTKNLQQHRSPHSWLGFTWGTLKGKQRHKSLNIYHPTASFSFPFTIHGNFCLSCNSLFFLKVDLYTHSLQKYLLSVYSVPGLALGTGDTKSWPSQSLSSSKGSHFCLFLWMHARCRTCTSRCGRIWSRLIQQALQWGWVKWRPGFPESPSTQCCPERCEGHWYAQIRTLPWT